jgi:hypothetical protein
MARVAAIFFDGSDLTVTIQQLLKKQFIQFIPFINAVSKLTVNAPPAPKQHRRCAWLTISG